jgi:hypothetical protein
MAQIPSPVNDTQQTEPVFVECCRKCSMKYQFRLDNGETVTVLCGRPITQKYKAVSYLWENTSDLPLKCQRCSVVTTIPMRDASKLWRLMKFVRGGSAIWLDAMSIDQTDPKDKAAQLFVMGDIYRRAEMVSVLLPNSDEEAYRKLAELKVVADAIVRRTQAFGMPLANSSDSIDTERIEVLQGLSDDYWAKIRDWILDIHKWSYWRRAWTFQEWAMASEIEISWEGAEGNENLFSIKNVIVMASTIIAHWRQTTARQSAAISLSDKIKQQMHLREEMGPGLNSVRAHFPFEDFLVADEAEDQDNLRHRTFTSGLPSATDSGTYVSLESRSTPPSKFRSLLGLALNSISTSKREATYEADLIACWASMCNIEYAYDKHDSFASALHKAIAALRKRGIKVYNFLVNTDSGETDLKFLDYAASHPQSNSPSKGYLLGTPIFIGRADTLRHIRNLLSQDGQRAHLDANCNILLRQVENVTVKRPILWSDWEKVIPAFRSMLSGKATGLLDIGEMVESLVIQLDPDQLGKYAFVTASIIVADVEKMWYFNAWAVCPSNINFSDLFVARESLNGTLVLAVYKGPRSDDEPAKEAEVVAYLNMTHQRDGTYLIKVDENGVVDVVFRTVDTPQQNLFELPQLDLGAIGGDSLLPEWNVLDVINDREFDMHISLAERELPLIGMSDREKT